MIMILLRILLAVLLVILGLIVLVLLVVLFLPIGYEIDARKEEDILCQLHVHALLKLIRFTAEISKKDEAPLMIHVTLQWLWKRKILFESDLAEAREESEETEAKVWSDQKETSSPSAKVRTSPHHKKEKKDKEESHPEDQKDTNAQKEQEAQTGTQEQAETKSEKASDTAKPDEEYQDADQTQDFEEKKSSEDEIWILGLYSQEPHVLDALDLSGVMKLLHRIREAAASAEEKLRLGADRIHSAACDKLLKIQNLIRKIERIHDFLTGDPDGSYVLHLLISKIKKILKRILPRRGGGYLRIGFDDPSTTGLLAGTYAFLQGYTGGMRKIEMDLIPEFEEKVFEGNVHLAGRVQGYHILFPVIGVAANKRVWRLIKKIRSLKQQE